MKSFSFRNILAVGSFVAFAALLFGIAPHVFAATDTGLATVGSTAGYSTVDIYSIIGSIINVFLSLLGIIFLILTIYAGAIWMTAGGDGKKVEKAKQILINATVGLVITLSAYGIASYVINLLTGGATSGGVVATSGVVSVERLSNSLGSGAIRDHYPERNATGIARNTKIFVTFRDQMDISSFITGYNTNKTPEDVSDDTAGSGINVDNIKIYVRDNGDTTALTDVNVSFTDDLKTFSFDPADNLGSATTDMTYAVFLSDKLKNVDGDTPLDSGGYLWYFTTSTLIDTTPPTVVSVTPVEGSSKDRNIAVQITFSEAVDPTSDSGIRETSSGFSNIQITGKSSSGVVSAPIAGNYVSSNGYKTTTFTSAEACGTNSCGNTIYCLPGGESISTTIFSATPTSETDPTATLYPYDGVVDTCGNAMDGNADGKTTQDDDYTWGFSTTNNINLTAPTITAITPNIKEENVTLDQSLQVTFDSILLSTSANGSSIPLANKEIVNGTSHEMWYNFRSVSLDSSNAEVTTASQTPVKSLLTINHGTFLASDQAADSANPLSYMYSITANEGVLNEYQNCFVPGEGPDVNGISCGAVKTTLPYCCNGSPQATACTLF